MFLCSLNKNPEVELLDRMVVLFLILFSIVAVPIYIPINSAQGFPFLHTLASICHLLGFCLFVCFVLFLIVAISNSVRCYLIVVLFCSSLMISNIKYLFMYLLAIFCVASLGRMSVHILSPFF